MPTSWLIDEGWDHMRIAYGPIAVYNEYFGFTLDDLYKAEDAV